MKIRSRKETREQIRRGIFPAEVLDWVGDGAPEGAEWEDKTGSVEDFEWRRGCVKSHILFFFVKWMHEPEW